MSALPKPEEKAAYVQQSFANIARGYDQANRVMTLGLDLGWREQVVKAVAPPFNGRALDVGTGTGDFLPMLAAWMPHGIAVGVDFCLPMMQEGQPKIDRIPTASDDTSPGTAVFVNGDALRLPFPDNSFDAITTGFVMRNVTDIAASLREMWRVARPGGTMACLEVARPRNPLVRLGHRLYFDVIMPRIGAIINPAQRVFYTSYLPASARVYPPADEFARLMHAAGWRHVSYTLHGMGAAAIHVGTKLSADEEPDR
jgi:demethylmenaquinone methyltransferase/2-methoxy-6-polyprenyl-1,4-benzoquinol methylase